MKRTLSFAQSIAALSLTLSSATALAQQAQTPPAQTPQVQRAPQPVARDTAVNWAIPNVLPDQFGRVAAPTPPPGPYVVIPAVAVTHPPAVVRQRVEIYGSERRDVDPAAITESVLTTNVMGTFIPQPTHEALTTAPRTEPAVEVAPEAATESASVTESVSGSESGSESESESESESGSESVPAPVATPTPVTPTPSRVIGHARVTQLRVAPPPETLTRIERPRNVGNDPGVDGGLPRGRAIANLSGDACMQILRERRVAFEEVDADDAEGVRTPIRVTTALAGIEIAPRESNDRLHAIMDCRMAVAVLAWAPALRAAGVHRIEHYSIFRPHAVVAGTDTRSGHASAMALDSAIYYFNDGTHSDVLHEWGERTHGNDPCGEYEGETDHAKAMRRVVCSAIHDEIFEIVLTPHYDRAHQNHVHLELRPNVNWAFIH